METILSGITAGAAGKAGLIKQAEEEAERRLKS